MTKIIDLGNGYGRIEGYHSKYASLTFPLTLSKIRRLHAMGYISNDELQEILLEMEYSPSEVKLLVAIGSVTVKQWRERAHGLGII